MRRSRAVISVVASLLTSMLIPCVAIGNPGDYGTDTLTASGIAGDMCFTQLGNLDPNNSHVNETMWLWFGGYWTEVGIWYGNNINSPGQTTYQPRFYWMDANTVYNLSWHGDFNDTPTPGAYYHAYIKHRTGNWWNVYINNWTTGSGSYHAASTGDSEYVGDEYTEATDNIESGAVQNVGYWNSSGGWHLGWPNALNHQENGSPGQGFWYQPYFYYSTKLNAPWSC